MSALFIILNLFNRSCHMKAGITALLIIITFITNAQDSLNFSQLNFKSIKNKEVLVYAKWNNHRPCSIPLAIPSLFPDLDTNEMVGETMTDKEWESLHLDKTKFDTIDKCGKVEIGRYTAYIVRYKYGNLPQTVYLFLYNKDRANVYSLEIASYTYGESGSACLLSVLLFDKKNEKILITSFTESEGWVFTEDEVR